MFFFVKCRDCNVVSFQVHWNRLKDPVSAIMVRINTENQFNFIIIRKCGLSTSKNWLIVLKYTEEMIRRTNILEVKEKKIIIYIHCQCHLWSCKHAIMTVCNMVYDIIISNRQIFFTCYSNLTLT